MVCLVLATSLHALLVLGVSFGISMKAAPRLAETLDVVLVKWRSEEAPEEADFLAQATQKGGGESIEKSRPTQQLSGELPSTLKGQDIQQSSPSIPLPDEKKQEIVVK